MSRIDLLTPKFHTAFRRLVLRAWCGLRPGQTWCVSQRGSSIWIPEGGEGALRAPIFKGFRQALAERLRLPLGAEALQFAYCRPGKNAKRMPKGMRGFAFLDMERPDMKPILMSDEVDFIWPHSPLTGDRKSRI